MQSQLENQLHTLGLNFYQFNDSKNIIDDLNKNLKEVEVIRNDPENFISNYRKTCISGPWANVVAATLAHGLQPF